MSAAYAIDPLELSALEPQPVPDFDTEDEETLLQRDEDAVPTRRTYGAFERPKVSPEDAAADALRAAEDEHSDHVEKLMEAAHASPSVVFDRCMSVGNAGERQAIRSRESLVFVEFGADVFLAAKFALRNDEKLWCMYRLLFERGQVHEIPLYRLARSADVQAIKYQVGIELTRRGLANIAAYTRRNRKRCGR